MFSRGRASTHDALGLGKAKKNLTFFARPTFGQRDRYVLPCVLRPGNGANGESAREACFQCDGTVIRMIRAQPRVSW